MEGVDTLDALFLTSNSHLPQSTRNVFLSIYCNCIIEKNQKMSYNQNGLLYREGVPCILIK